MDWIRGRVLGRGSTASVSLAISPQSSHLFAVKFAEFSSSEFLRREQHILSSVSSPYIVSYIGSDVTKEDDKVMYNLLLEYMPGGTLSDIILSQGGRLSESMIRRYTWQLLQGLDYLHSIGIVHCDIKGRNILVGQQGGAKIADFGCAKWVEPEKAAIAGNVSGTPMFMAPEVARGESQGFASDIWSLGCTIIEMATGSGPWPNSKDPISVIYRVGYLGQVPEFPSWLSEEAKDFLDKCLSKDPKERWTTSQLLKHPFVIKTGSVEEFVTHTKQIQQSNTTPSNSPTSILDQQGFWNSFSESETSLESHLGHPSVVNERIRRLALVSGRPSWGSDDEKWVRVRVDNRDDVTGCGGLNEGMGLALLDSKLAGVRRCKYENDSCVISNVSCFERELFLEA